MPDIQDEYQYSDSDYNMGGDLNLSCFELAEFEISSEFETRYIKPKLPIELPESAMKYENAEQLAKDVPIDKGTRHYVLINGSFIFGDYIEALCVINDWHVKKLTISTLGLNQNNVDSLANLINGGYADEVNLIISDYCFAHNRQGLIKYMYEELDKDNKFQLAVARTHCKIVLIETHCGLKIVLHGSANLRSSNNIEQFMIEENDYLYDFNNEYHSKIVEMYSTIKKSIGLGELWDKIK